MNSNNFIRKIDDLGRVVIPKEVRSKLKIGENENILISCDDSKINISKYSHLNNYHKFLNELANLLQEIYKVEITVYDREKEMYSNYSQTISNNKTEEIIKDSTKIGEITIYSNEKELLMKLSKFISRLISIYLATN